MVRFMSTAQEQCTITEDANQEKQNKKLKRNQKLISRTATTKENLNKNSRQEHK